MGERVKGRESERERGVARTVSMHRKTAVERVCGYLSR